MRDATPTIIRSAHLCDERGRPVAAVYRCRKAWEDLDPTSAATVRHCSACDQQVVQVTDVAGAVQAIARGACVAVDADDGPVLGEIKSPYGVSSGPLNWET